MLKPLCGLDYSQADQFQVGSLPWHATRVSSALNFNIFIDNQVGKHKLEMSRIIE